MICASFPFRLINMCHDCVSFHFSSISFTIKKIFNLKSFALHLNFCTVFAHRYTIMLFFPFLPFTHTHTHTHTLVLNINNGRKMSWRYWAVRQIEPHWTNADRAGPATFNYIIFSPFSLWLFFLFLWTLLIEIVFFVFSWIVFPIREMVFFHSGILK